MTVAIDCHRADLRPLHCRLNPEVDDLFLLEAHEIADLPVRVPARELGATTRSGTVTLNHIA